MLTIRAPLHYSIMCFRSLTKYAKNRKNCFSRVTTIQDVVQAKRHSIKRKTFTVQCCFYFFDIRTKKKSYSSLNNLKIMNYFETNRTFFVFVTSKK